MAEDRELHVVANPGFGSLYRANETVQALWHLLAEPVTLQQAIEIFRAAFPSEPAEDLAESVEEMLGGLKYEGLLEEVEPAQD